MKKLTTLFLLLLVQSANAQQLTLRQAVSRALPAQPSLELATANVERAEAAIKDARGALRPSLNVDAAITRFQEPMVVAPLHGFDPLHLPVFDQTLGQGNATLSYTLFDATRGARIDRLALLRDAARETATSARMQLLSDVVRAYTRLATARDLVVAQRRRTEALEREAERARLLVEQGKAARVVGLRAQSALSAARADGVSANGEVESAENDLARLTSISVDSIKAHQLPVPHLRGNDVAIETMRAASRESSPEILRARRQVAAAEAGRREASGLKLPRLQLLGRYAEYMSSATDPQGEWQAGGQLSYNVFGGARSSARDRANAELHAASAEMRLTERRIDEAIDRAFAAVRTARARVAALEAAVAQSEEVTRIDRLALESGAGVQSEYLTAEADLFRARAGLSDARALELIARTELARVTGQLDEEWIIQNVESQQ